MPKVNRMIDRAAARDDVEELVRLALTPGAEEASAQLVGSLSAVAVRLREQARFHELARLLMLPTGPQLAPAVRVATDLLTRSGPAVASAVFRAGRNGDLETKARAERILKAVGEPGKAAEMRRLIAESDQIAAGCAAVS